MIQKHILVFKLSITFKSVDINSFKNFWEMFICKINTYVLTKKAFCKHLRMHSNKILFVNKMEKKISDNDPFFLNSLWTFQLTRNFVLYFCVFYSYNTSFSTCYNVGRDLYMKYIEIVGYADVVLMKNSKHNFCMRFHTLYFEDLENREREHRKACLKTTKGKQEKRLMQHSLSPTDLFGEVE